MERTKRTYFIGIVCAIFSLIFFIAAGGNAFSASAATDPASDVLTDLQHDKNFDVRIYPVIDHDTSLQVIQIAESTEGELLVYVYNPTGKQTATSINISTATDGNPSFHNYKLNLLSRQDALSKYVVNGLGVNNEPVRRYEISSIFRAWDKAIDAAATGGNTVSEVSDPVGLTYSATTEENGEITYACVGSKTVTISSRDKFCGSIRYVKNSVISIYQDDTVVATDAWYVAFSTQEQIDRLMEAEVEFIIVDYIIKKNLGGLIESSTYSDTIEKHVCLSELDEADVRYMNKWGSAGSRYTWNRIQSVSEFLSVEKNNISAETKTEVESKDWVLRFAETDYYRTDTAGSFNLGVYYQNGSNVNQVTILRLKFETDGEVYNLGVVDNKQTSSGNPDIAEEPDTDFDIRQWFADLLHVDIKTANIIFWVVIAGLVVLIVIGYIAASISKKKKR